MTTGQSDWPLVKLFKSCLSELLLDQLTVNGEKLVKMAISQWHWSPVSFTDTGQTSIGVYVNSDHTD